MNVLGDRYEKPLPAHPDTPSPGVHGHLRRRLDEPTGGHHRLTKTVHCGRWHLAGHLAEELELQYPESLSLYPI